MYFVIQIGKKGQILAILCNKWPNLHTCMQLFDTVLVFYSVECVGNGKGVKDMFKHLTLQGSPRTSSPFKSKRLIQCIMEGQTVLHVFRLLKVFCQKSRENNLIEEVQLEFHFDKFSLHKHIYVNIYTTFFLPTYRSLLSLSQQLTIALHP